MMLDISGFGLSKMAFEFVPIQDFSVAWSDEMLYKKYNFSDEEMEFIDSMIKPYRSDML
jgi:site-specific DNA-methyltransferase (adenine-specific)